MLVYQIPKLESNDFLGVPERIFYALTLRVSCRKGRDRDIKATVVGVWFQDDTIGKRLHARLLRYHDVVSCSDPLRAACT